MSLSICHVPPSDICRNLAACVGVCHIKKHHRSPTYTPRKVLGIQICCFSGRNELREVVSDKNWFKCGTLCEMLFSHASNVP